MSTHSINSPSVFHRRIACPGSRAGEEGKTDTTSVYAAEGTAAHWLGATVLDLDKTIDRTNVRAFVGKMTPTVNPTKPDKSCFPVTEEMADAVDVYVDYCRALINMSDRYGIEEKFALTFIGDDEKGSADFWSIGGGVLEVVDYKHGQGHAVNVPENPQGICYGLGAARKYADHDWDTLKITIVQPRAFHSQGSIRSWEMSREEADEYYMDYAHYSSLTYEPDAPRIPGDHCTFCKAQPCYAQEQAVADTTGIEVVAPKHDDWVPRNVDSMSVELLADLIINKKLDIVEAWCSSVRVHAKELHEQGTEIPGMKIVPTRATRYFKTGVDVEDILIEQFANDVEGYNSCRKPSTLKTLAQIEKAIGKPLFAEIFETADPTTTMIESISSGTVLVGEDDPRNPVKSLGVDDFDDLTI